MYIGGDNTSYIHIYIHTIYIISYYMIIIDYIIYPHDISELFQVTIIYHLSLFPCLLHRRPRFRTSFFLAPWKATGKTIGK